MLGGSEDTGIRREVQGWLKRATSMFYCAAFSNAVASTALLSFAMWQSLKSLPSGESRAGSDGASELLGSAAWEILVMQLVVLMILSVGGVLAVLRKSTFGLTVYMVCTLANAMAGVLLAEQLISAFRPILDIYLSILPRFYGPEWYGITAAWCCSGVSCM